MYNPIRTNWFYSYVDVPNLDSITTELIKLSEDVVHLKRRTNPFYVNVSAEDGIDACPTLKCYLQECGILTKLNRFLFSSNQVTSSVIHVDSYDPAYTQCSLNFALKHCENSYTAFYKTNLTTLIDSGKMGLHAPSNFAWTYAGAAEEIARVEVIRPMVVNTTILHRGITDNPFRSICGLRFIPELDEENLKQMGIKNPFTQE
jgi:hypothetical protein